MSGTQFLRFRFQQAQTVIERFLEARFLELQSFDDQGLRFLQFRIGLAHVGEQGGEEAVHERLLRAQDVRMAHAAAHDAAEHVAAALVRRHHAVGDEERA